ncbi:chymotrypsin-2-like [Anthonomus grandis grandis]|uniref:chymotrypsin-2-like n=1 Tax=Anthonomus grandis grandis TaxID=2921223 RepID=UPI0021667865|nr:chymotrypsin-2-like [Anthonomus grandis grandis]
MKLLIVLSALVAVALGAAIETYEATYLPINPNITYDDSSLKIVNGHNAARNQFPYIVSLQRRVLANSFSHTCGGSILSPQWILSAAHCTQLAASNYRVVAGIILLSDNNIVGQQILSVQQIINHPSYPGGSVVAPDDVSVLRLSGQLQYTVNVQPISIPRQGALFQGESVLCGWGLLQTGGSTPNHLQWANLPIVPEQECNIILNGFLGASRNPFSVQLNVCSGTRTGRESACNGDSGSPLVHNGLVIGIASWVLLPCGGMGAPSVYARTAAYSDWIVRSTNGAVSLS